LRSRENEAYNGFLTPSFVVHAFGRYPMIITYFKCAADFRAWLDEHSLEAQELWVG
jgi:hypothetical protein